MSSRSSSRRSGADSSEPVAVGRVLSAHGIRGELTIDPLSDNPSRFRAGSRLQAGSEDGDMRPLEILTVRPHRGRLLVRFAGIEDRNQAEELAGRRLFVSEEDLPEPPEGSYYHFQLEGCRVEDVHLGDLGEVRRVLEEGGGEILEVVAPGRTVLVPFVEPYLRNVDVEARLIETDLPEGLVEACGST